MIAQTPNGFYIKYDVAADRADTALHGALKRFSLQHPHVKSVQLVRDAPYAQEKSGVAIEPAASWLAALEN